MSAGYKDALRDAMTELGKSPDTIVVGYNTSKVGGHGAGSFAGFPEERIVEMPLCENLMVGVAIGLALDGKVPLIFFERFDFALLACDAIVNHLSKISELSDGLHKPACIIRCVVGNSKTPLFTGLSHTQNLSEVFRKMVSFPVLELHAIDTGSIVGVYQLALSAARKGESTMLVEFKDNL